MSDAPATGAVAIDRRGRVRARVRLAWRRVAESVPAIAQIVVAATGAFAFSHFVLGHPSPLLTTTVTISSLGLVRDVRPRRLVETLAGMLVGVAVAEVLRLALGTGWWQLAIALALTLVVGRLLSPQPGFAIAAAIQSGIVMVIPGNAPFERLTDAFVGALAALAVTALIPRNAVRAEMRTGRALFDALEDTLMTLVQALRRGDRMRGQRGLEKARAMQPVVDAWRDALDSGIAIARIAPFLRSQRFELQRHERMRQSTDFAVRNLRVVARRVAYLTDDETPHPVVADVVAEIARAAALVGVAVEDLTAEPAAREAVRAVALRLDPAAILPDGSQSEQNVLAALRPLAVDLLTATGMPPVDARATLPRI